MTIPWMTQALRSTERGCRWKVDDETSLSKESEVEASVDGD
jgi:hypothetical protein